MMMLRVAASEIEPMIGALDALVQIAATVGGKIPLFMDSGVRCGADAFKAMALGAKAVGIGRPYVYGLALKGEEGVAAVMEHLTAELDLTMALSGARSPAEITPDLLQPRT